MHHAAYNIACKMQHSGVCSSASERSDAFAIGGVNAVVDHQQEHRDCSAVSDPISECESTQVNRCAQLSVLGYADAHRPLSLNGPSLLLR